MAKEALYLVHAELDPAIVADWAKFHAKEHVPMVVKAAGFLGAQRYRHVGGEGRFTTAYRAANLGVVRGYLEGGEVGRMRAHHDAWLATHATHKTSFKREVLEENYSVGADGKPLVRDAAMSPGRAAFVVRVRIDPASAGAWSTWYDREHMPEVVAAGGFLRAGRWRIVDEAAGAARFAVLYEAASAQSIAAFRAGAGPALSKEHESRFGASVVIEREVWGETD